MIGLPETGLVIQHHTHQWGHSVREGGCIAFVDAGMVGAADTEQYKLQASGKWRPGVPGGIVFEQDEAGDTWKTDLRSVRPLWPVQV